MTTGRRFGLLLGTAKAGWLPFVFVLDDRRLELVASSVLNDPLDELTEVAVAVATPGPVDAAVRIWEEPATTEIRFTGKQASSLLTIEVSETGEWPGSARRRLANVRYSQEFDRLDVATKLVDALRVYETRHPRTGKIEGWGSFPSKKLRRLVPELAEGARTFLAPWHEVHGLQRVVDELKAEVGPKHPLFNVGVSVVARRADNDDYLFELQSGPDPFAVVHLTWTGTREHDPTYPSTEFFGSWNDWVDRRMVPDSIEHRDPE
jgi:hypothetical protein